MDGQLHNIEVPGNLCVRNKANPLDNNWLKLLWTDWFENLSDKFALKQIVKMTIQSEKNTVRSDWFQNLFRTLNLPADSNALKM